MLHIVVQKADILGSYVIFTTSNRIEVFIKFATTMH